MRSFLELAFRRKDQDFGGFVDGEPRSIGKEDRRVASLFAVCIVCFRRSFERIPTESSVSSCLHRSVEHSCYGCHDLVRFSIMWHWHYVFKLIVNLTDVVV